jgi:glutamate-1-semialdehyde 2,1-aminomutase
MQTILEEFETTFKRDREISEQSQSIFPDGVTHDNRHSDPFPVYISHGDGSKKYGLDGREFIDFWSGHGSLLLSHNPPEVVEAVQKQISRGTHYGGSHELEIEWARLVLDLIPSAEKIRFVNSGTEATHMAIRLARTFTGKSRIVKFSGHFHGWHDAVAPAARPPLDEPVPGIPQSVLDHTLVLPPNNIDIVAKTLAEDDIACLMIEPTGAGFCTMPCPEEFLHQLREVTARHNVVLLFDEVVTGFRVSPGGAQGLYGITPDLTSLAKILAGGLPGGALCGREDIMDLISIKRENATKSGQKMPHPGTFNGNPLSASAGIATLKIAATGDPQKRAAASARRLITGFNEIIDRHDLDWAVYGAFSGFHIHIAHGLKVKAADFDPLETDLLSLKATSRPDLTKHVRCGMFLNGVDMSMGTGLTMAAHTDTDIDAATTAFDTTLSRMKSESLI